MDPDERLTAIEALRHPYFIGLNSEFIKPPKTLKTTKRNPLKNRMSKRTMS